MKITLTCTSGRRLELFQRTMRSFHKNCKDVDLIDKYLIMDDGSSSRELAQMKREFPHITIHKSRGGQPASLNDLFGMVDTEWFLHIEDDWEFFREGHFIREAFEVTHESPKIKNVVVRGWQPIDKDHLKQTSSGLNYVIHKHDTTAGRVMMLAADTEWYGWSLNPGLQHTETVMSLPKFDESRNDVSRFWDKEPAMEYLNKGYLRASLYKGYVVHIGNQSLYEMKREGCAREHGCSEIPEDRECEKCSMM